MMSLKIVITGSTGLVGKGLVQYFSSQGHRVVCLVRNQFSCKENPQNIYWDYTNGKLDRKALEGVDVVIHLAGANIASKRWTKTYKDIIDQSRRASTRFLAENLAKLTQKPKVFLSASAVGFYGPQEPHVSVDEASPAGDDFLARVCKDWERASEPAVASGIRTIYMRTGMVLSPQGGALGKMFPIFKMGLGGVVGSGKQMMSWISIDEIPRIIEFLIQRTDIAGPINFVSPQAVTNKEFTKILGEVIHRPTIFPLPSFAVKILLGEMGETLLLSGANVLPQRLLKHGYIFQNAELKGALKALIHSAKIHR
jgi:uncharacterized protein (TIGR01777 family)